MRPRLCAARQCRRVSRSDFFVRRHDRFQIGESRAAAAGRANSPAKRSTGTANSPAPLKRGVDTFRAFVESWYRGGFQKIIFHADPPPDIRRMISAILAGYAWDQSNPYVARHPAALGGLEELCCEGDPALSAIGGSRVSRSAAPYALSAERIGLKLAPATLGASVSLQQHLHRAKRRAYRRARYRTGNRYRARSIWSARVLGQRILALHYDGRTVRVLASSDLCRKQLRGEDVLEDLQLTLWPVEVIRGLASRLAHRRMAVRRSFTSDDVPVMVIEYSASRAGAARSN